MSEEFMAMVSKLGSLMILVWIFDGPRRFDYFLQIVLRINGFLMFCFAIIQGLSGNWGDAGGGCLCTGFAVRLVILNNNECFQGD